LIGGFVVKKFAALLMLGAIAGCTSLPWAPIPTPELGIWQLDYELSAADSAAINSLLTKRLKLAYYTGSTGSRYISPLNEQGEYMFATYFVSPKNGEVWLDLSDCADSVTGGCNKMKFMPITSREMVGTMEYYDSKRSLKVGPAKVTARLVSPEQPSASPSP
jgi:hypothetical protein